jgi:hypothetical protein
VHVPLPGNDLGRHLVQRAAIDARDLPRGHVQRLVRIVWGSLWCVE